MKTCAFTGHRPQNLSFGFNENDLRCIKLKKVLNYLIRETIEKCGVAHFFTGMALGTDIFAAEEIICLKNKYPFITLTAVLPCADQTLKWNNLQTTRYKMVLEKCNKVITLQKNYSADCMNRRNRYMIDLADYLLAVWNGSKSGTGNTVKYALERKIPTIILNPDNFCLTRI